MHQISLLIKGGRVKGRIMSLFETISVVYEISQFNRSIIVANVLNSTLTVVVRFTFFFFFFYKKIFQTKKEDKCSLELKTWTQKFNYIQGRC